MAALVNLVFCCLNMVVFHKAKVFQQSCVFMVIRAACWNDLLSTCFTLVQNFWHIWKYIKWHIIYFISIFIYNCLTFFRFCISICLSLMYILSFFFSFFSDLFVVAECILNFISRHIRNRTFLKQAATRTDVGSIVCSAHLWPTTDAESADRHWFFTGLADGLIVGCGRIQLCPAAVLFTAKLDEPCDPVDSCAVCNCCRSYHGTAKFFVSKLYNFIIFKILNFYLTRKNSKSV